ncbi:esterase B1-like [Anticarsia gemmatalis]|uniref:esterase B1-like n=1 Tax=Anticarsia gemmatalis TaxID=129554 RepID=UPI003F7600B1
MASISPIVILITLAVYGIADDAIQVTVEQGKLAGEQVTSITNVTYYSFKGIPYAKAPIGELRFKAPQDPECWDGVRDATKHGSICPQLNILTNVYDHGNEDCLFVNVYTPNLKPDKLLSVLVWIHGGAFLFGSGDTAMYGPDFHVSELVVVTLNYRLDTLGFLSLGNCDVPGNAGLKDQVAALKWVQKNIKNFGGDPDSVTIMGGTAGSSSVGFHLVSPMSKGLFKRAIAMSGATSCDSVYPYQPVRRAFTLAQNLGYEASNTTDLLQFLQNVNYDKLINKTASIATVLVSEETTDIPFKMQPFTAPVIEPKCKEPSFIPKDPFEAIERRNVNKADVLFGYSSQETLLLAQQYAESIIQSFKRYPENFVPSKLLVSCTPDTILKLADKIKDYYFGDKAVSADNLAEFITYSNHANINIDMQRYFRRWSKVGKTYSFLFSGYTKRNYYAQQVAQYGVTGAAHLDIEFYLFDPKSMSLPLEENSPELKIVQDITSAVKNFVLKGDPTPDSLGSTWSPFKTRSLSYVNFGENLTTESKADDDAYNFWKGIFKDAGVTF